MVKLQIFIALLKVMTDIGIANLKLNRFRILPQRSET